MVLFNPCILFSPHEWKEKTFHTARVKSDGFLPFQRKKLKKNVCGWKTWVCFLSLRVLSFVHHSDRKSTFLTPRFYYCLRNYYFPQILQIYPWAKEPPSDKSEESSENNNFFGIIKSGVKNRRFSILVMK